MNFLDLFSGIGGFALGAYWAGLRADRHYFSEIDPWAVRLYQERFPDAIGLGDITKIKTEELKNGEHWIMAGGFPCQDLSDAGHRTGIHGSRSGLWFRYAEIIRDLLPKYAIMENVGAISHRGIDSVLGSLAEIGYSCEWFRFDASDIGAPHKRERIFFVAYADVARKWRDTRKEKNEKNATPIRTKFFSNCGQWEKRNMPEPIIYRIHDGVSGRMDRLKGLGNSIIPQIAYLIFRSILDAENETPRT